MEVIQAPPLWQGAEPKASNIDDIRCKYSLPDKFFLYPAQFWEHKNHARLIDAFAVVASEFPSLHLVLTGHRQHRYQAVMTQVTNLKLSNRVLHLGYVPTTDIFGLYQLSTALIMPSLFESISIPIFEAFRARVPVCASGIMALTEQVGDAGLIFDPMSIVSIANAMRRILVDEALRGLLVSNGSQRIANITMEKYASDLDNLLKKVSSGAGASTP